MPFPFRPIPRDPQAPLLTRRALDNITDVLNDLISSGVISPTAAPGGSDVRWTIPGATAGAAGRLGPPGVDGENGEERVLVMPQSGVRSPGMLFTHFTDGSSTHTDGTFDTLYTDTLFANQLSRNGDALDLCYAGNLVDSAGTATREIKFFFGGVEQFTSGAFLVTTLAAWQLRATVVRVSATVVRVTGVFLSEATFFVFTGEQTGLTLSAANAVAVKGAATGTGAASGDIKAQLGTITFTPAP